MIDVIQYNKDIASASIGVRVISTLNQEIRTKKKFLFDRTELAAIEEILLSQGIIRVEGEKLYLVPGGLLSYMALLNFQLQFNFSPNGSLSKLFQFLKRIDEFFDQNHFQGRQSYLKEINAIALFINHSRTLDSFEDFSSKWEKVPDNALYIYANAFGKILPFLTDEPNIIYGIISKLLAALEFNKQDVHNVSVYDLYGSFFRYAVAQPQNAKRILKIAEEKQDDFSNVVAGPIITGLLDADQAYLDQLSEFLEIPFYHVPIAAALTKTELSSQKAIDKALSIFQQMETKGANVDHFRVEFYISIINNPNCVNQDVVNFSFEQIRIDLLNSNEKVWHPALRFLSMINNKEERVTNLLIEFVRQEHFSKESIPTISHGFFAFENCNNYFNFLEAYGAKWRYSLHEGIFKQVNYLRDKNRRDFDQRLINLMTHDKGYIRHIGERLFSTLSFSQGIQEFAIGLCDLNPLLQFKIITAVLANFHEPKFTVPFLLPLLDTSHPLIVEILVSRLEVLTDDYGSAVTDVLKRKLDLTLPENKLIFERVETRMLKFATHLKSKSAIKELNPWYSDSKEFNYFINLYRQEFAKSISKHVDEHSIFRHFATTVILAKGGGWKHPTRNEVSQLGKFGSSFTLPRSFYVSPDNFEFERKLDLFEDWSQLFDGWEATLLS